jgi:Restriction endonuclease
MPHPWQAYQEEVAAFFQSLGLAASTEVEIQGVRATHRVDVVVSFALLGVKITWIVECKLWGKPVPKEKVLALHQIAQDVGADRAFLMSENSFQPGAVAAARSTNISLTSLADLRETARADLAQLQLRTVITRLLALERLARSGFIDEEGNVRRFNPKSFDESIDLAGCCLFLERAAVRGLAGEFPVYVRGVDISKTEEFDAAPDLAAFLVRELETIEQRLSKLDMYDPDLAADTASFMQSVRSLLDSSEEALTKLLPSDKTFEAKRYECLALMKAVGRSSELLRSRGKPRFQEALRAVMRHLVDTVYLDLTKPSVTEARWLADREGTERHLADLQSAMDE